MTALTIVGLADYLGISRSTVDRRIATNEWPYRRIGSGKRSVIRFLPADVARIEALIAVEPTPVTPPTPRRRKAS